MDREFAKALIEGAAGMGTGLAVSGVNAIAGRIEADRAYDRQLEFWKMQNEYNSPHSQRKRLARAGLNPSAAFGEIAAGQQAGELSSVPRNEAVSTGMFDLSAMVDALKSFSEIENIAAGTDKLTAEVATEMLEQVLKKLGIEEKEIEIGKKKIEYESWQNRVNAEIEKIRKEGYRAWAEGQSAEKKLPYEIGSLEAGIREKDSATALNEAKTETENQLREFEKNLKSAQTQQARASAARDFAEARSLNITSSLQEKYGDRDYAARVTSAEAAAKYAEDLQAAAVRLQETSAALNENQALTNDAKIEIERAANDIKERALALDENKFQLETVKAGTDAIIKIVNAATPW